ncbi:MAG: hypothetical protein ACM3RX_03570 [Methanococcaceae archaeon]
MKKNGFIVCTFFLMLTGIIFLIPSNSFAQRGARDPEKMTASLKERLSLNDKQAEAVKEILIAAQDSAKKDMASTATREERRTLMMERMKNTDKKIMELLDDNQKKEYDKVLEERKNRFRNN